jgi:hypothetical protein
MERWQERENREFLRAGTIAAAAVNPHRDSRRHPEAYTAVDFFDLPRPARPKPTAAEIAQNADRVFSFHNEREKRAAKRRERRRNP